MGDYTDARSARLARQSAERREMIRNRVLTVLVALLLVGGTYEYVQFDRAMDRSDAARESRVHAQMDEMAHKVDPSARVVFESWNNGNPEDVKYGGASAKVIFGASYRWCDFTTKYGMVCASEQETRAIEEASAY